MTRSCGTIVTTIWMGVVRPLKLAQFGGGSGLNAASACGSDACLQIAPQRLASFFTAIARLAITAKGQFYPACKPFIDENLTSTNAPCGPVRGVDISGKDAADKPVLCCWRCRLPALRCLFSVSTDRAKYFGAGDLHVGVTSEITVGANDPGRFRRRPLSNAGAFCRGCLNKPFPRSRCGSDTMAPIFAPKSVRRSRGRPTAPRQRHTSINDLVMDVLMRDHPRHCQQT